VVHLFLEMVRKVDKNANFVFVQLTEHEPRIYDKHHPDYARWDKIDLAWERISHEMKESDIYIYIYIYLCVCVCVCARAKTYNRTQIQNMSAKATQTTTIIWPVLCDTSQQFG
jgi:hypothetical protein